MPSHTAILVALTLFFIDPAAQASNMSVDPSIATAAAIAPGAIVVRKDLTPGIWSVQPSVGYFNGTSSFDGGGATVSSRGWGGTGQAEYSWSEHVGLSFSAMVYKGSGEFTPGAIELGATSGSASVDGWLLGAAFVLDPFSGNGFRLPFFIGFNYQHLTSSTPTSPTVISMSLDSPGITFGFSPRFNLGFLRIEPFMVTTTATEKGNVGCNADVVVGLCGAANVQVLPVTGVNAIFRPWNFSFYFNFSTLLLGTGISFYSVGHQFSF